MTPGTWLLIVGGGMIAILAVVTWRDSKVTKRLNREGVCPVCGEESLIRLAEEAYDCAACGYQGGERREAYDSARRRALYAELPFEKRLAMARADLEEARSLVRAAVEPAPRVGAAYRALDALFDWDEVGSSRRGGSFALGGAAVDVSRAARLVMEVAEKIPEVSVLQFPTFSNASGHFLVGLAESVYREADKVAAQLDWLEADQPARES